MIPEIEKYLNVKVLKVICNKKHKYGIFNQSIIHNDQSWPSAYSAKSDGEYTVLYKINSSKMNWRRHF